MSKRRSNRRPPSQHNASVQYPFHGTHYNLSLPVPRGVTGYILYGVAPLPVRLGVGESVRVEPTKDGYNLWEIGG